MTGPTATSNHKSQSLNFRYILTSGLAGGIAGCVAKTVVAPLDRVKILFQASNPDFHKYAGTWSGALRAGTEIYRTAGVRGLFQGHSATLLRVFPYAGVKFMVYDQAKGFLMPTKEKETNVRRFAAGAISGIVSVFFTYPLELVRVRMAFHTRSSTSTSTPASTSSSIHTSTSTPIATCTSTATRPSFLRACAQVYHEGAEPIPPSSTSSHPSHPLIPASPHIPPHTLSHTPAHAHAAAPSPFTQYPLLKFYRGFFVTVLGMVPYAGISFLSWEFLRAKFVQGVGPDGKARPTPLPDLLIGALSGVLAQTASYPLEVVRRRMQVGGLTRPARWVRVGECVREIWGAGVKEYWAAHGDGSGGPDGLGCGSSTGRVWGARMAGMRGFYVGLGIGYLKMVPMTAVSFAVWQGAKRVLGI